MIAWIKNFLILILELTFIMLIEHYFFDTKKDLLFIDAVLVVLIVDLIDRRSVNKNL